NFTSFYLFRTNVDALTIYLPNNAGFEPHEVQKNGAETIAKVLPTVFRLHEKVGLPESAPIRWLAGDSPAKSSLEQLTRKNRVTLFEGLLDHLGWFADKNTVAQAADQIVSAFAPYVGGTDLASEA